MPFNHHGNRSFTGVSIDNNAPAASGVYGLSDARGWIYVGEAANIHAELRKHFAHPDPFLKAHRPSGFTFELCPAEQRVDRQHQLVVELAPIANRRA
jgi:hypothetical protein